MGVNHPGLEPTMQDLIRTIRRIARQTIQNAAIGRAGIRVYDGGWITVENGGLEVEGIARVVGTLEGTGTLNWWGPWFLRGNGTISGNQNVTGETTYTGKVTVNGPLDVVGAWKLIGSGDIAGNVNLTGDMSVKSGGSITVQGSGGSVVLSSTYGSPRINLGGAQIDGGASFRFTAGTNTVYFADGTIQIAGMPTVMQSSYPGSFPGAVVADAYGRLYRVV